jgi:hypothetical protein
MNVLDPAALRALRSNLDQEKATRNEIAAPPDGGSQ